MARAFPDPLNDAVAARAALPKLCLDWPDELAGWLGRQVQQAYPELRGWPVTLAAEAQLLFELYHPVHGSREVERNDHFLPFVRSLVDALVHDKPSRDHCIALVAHEGRA